MRIITCNLPNASTRINGVKFTEAEDGLVSEPVALEVAATFAGIPGYEVTDVRKTPEKAEAPEAKKEPEVSTKPAVAAPEKTKKQSAE